MLSDIPFMLAPLHHSLLARTLSEAPEKSLCNNFTTYEYQLEMRGALQRLI